MIFHYFYKGKEETIDTWDFPSGFGFLGAYAEEHIVGFAIIREEENGKIGVYGIDDKGKFNQGQEDVLDWIEVNVSWLVRDNLILDEQSAGVELIPTLDFENDPDNAATHIPNAFIKSCRIIKEGQPDGGGDGGDGDGGGGDGGGGGYFKRIFKTYVPNLPGIDAYSTHAQDDFSGAASVAASLIAEYKGSMAANMQAILNAVPNESRIVSNLEWDEPEFRGSSLIGSSSFGETLVKGSIGDITHEALMEGAYGGYPEGYVPDRDSPANHDTRYFRWSEGELLKRIDAWYVTGRVDGTYDLTDPETGITEKREMAVTSIVHIIELRCWVSA